MVREDRERTTGRSVLATWGSVDSTGWRVFVEQPAAEVLAPIYYAFSRTAILLVLGILLSAIASWVLARRMVRPIYSLQSGAAKIGSGDLSQRIEICTDDELESLADEFNHMASRLQESYAGLE